MATKYDPTYPIIKELRQLGVTKYEINFTAKRPIVKIDGISVVKIPCHTCGGRGYYHLDLPNPNVPFDMDIGGGLGDEVRCSCGGSKVYVPTDITRDRVLKVRDKRPKYKYRYLYEDYWGYIHPSIWKRIRSQITQAKNEL